MKIYLFDPESGFYLGEDFADEALQRGKYTLPPDATAVAPPPAGRGAVAVFNQSEQRWEISARSNGRE